MSCSPSKFSQCFADVETQIMAILYPTLQIVMVVRGGGGKHTWDVTYAEYYMFNKVRSFFLPSDKIFTEFI